MKTITITGASDDLIEIGGDITEEFGVYLDDEDKTYVLAVSDGTLLRVIYDGLWRFTPIVKGSAAYSKVDGVVADDTNDVVTLIGENLQWVVFGSEHAR